MTAFMLMMDVTAPTSLLPAAKASGRCPPILIRDNDIVEGGVFEMAMLRALDRTQSGECLQITSEFVLNWVEMVWREGTTTT